MSKSDRDPDERRPPAEKPIKLPDDFEQTLRDLLATGPTPKEEKDERENDEPETR